LGVAQLNIYVPDGLAERLKRDAQRAGIPLSRYVLSLISSPMAEGWPTGYFDKACGFLREDFPEPEDRLPESVDLAENGL
jgi:hypothetical protein